jgi:hypothetical protein
MAKKKIPSNTKPQRARKRQGNAGGTVLTVIIIALLTAVVGIYLITRYGTKLLPFFIPHKISKPGTKTINLYFPNQDGLVLKAEKREIAKGDLTKEIQESVEGLIKGPQWNLTSSIPDGTKLLGVMVKEEVAFLNFSKEISERHPGGSSAELQTIYSIVNTVTLNFPDIKKVQLLIEGKKVNTLAGHIDISFPLSQDKDLIKG